MLAKVAQCYDDLSVTNGANIGWLGLPNCSPPQLCFIILGWVLGQVFCISEQNIKIVLVMARGQLRPP